MAIYVIAQLTIHDRAGYQRYADAFLPILTKYGGSLLAADDHPEVVEGQWQGDRVVLFSFADRDAFVAWAMSAEYQQIVRYRVAASDNVGLVVHGLD